MTENTSRNSPLNVAINGFGRVGRTFFKIALDRETNFNIVGINDPAGNDRLIHLLKHDSSKGTWDRNPELNDGAVQLENQSIMFFSKRDHTKLPWDMLNVDVVIEASGTVKKRESALDHIRAGSFRVVVSTKIRNPDAMVIHGLNLSNTDLTNERIISNATCTAHALAPLVEVVDSEFGLVSGFCSVNHSLTRSQSLHDDPSNESKRKGRAGWESVIPAETPAASILGELREDWNNRLQSAALRVPVNNVSAVILSAKLEQSVNRADMIECFRKASEERWKNFVKTVSEPLVSSDFTASPQSSIFDENLVRISNQNHVQLVGWYDNEWGYCNRLVELANHIGSKKFGEYW